MPWSVSENDSRCPIDKPHAVILDADGTVVACHVSPEMAQRQVDALYANENGGKSMNKTYSAKYKALEGAEPGTFSAVVAVYGNVDKVGDRIIDGAFDASLKSWQAIGDPIPIVLAHEWKNPFAHIGWADPHKVKSVPGVGLMVEEGHLDLDNPTAAQVYKLMQRRTLKEFSFGYDIPAGGQMKASDGATELKTLDLIEFGPCLKGINDSTALVSIKSQLEAGEDDPFADLLNRLTVLEDILLGKAWDGTKSRWTDEEYAKACIVDRGADYSVGAKTRYSVPIADPGNSFTDPNPDALGPAAAALAGARGGVRDVTPEQMKVAYGRLIAAYRKMDMPIPDSVEEGAKSEDEPDETAMEDDILTKSTDLDSQIATLAVEAHLARLENELEDSLGGVDVKSGILLSRIENFVEDVD